MKEFYLFTLVVNGNPEEMVRLRFVGYAGQNKWLHFVNTKTLENHLCSPEQFPKYEIKNRENKLEFIYTAFNELPPATKPKPERKKQRFFSFDDFKKSYRV